MDAVTRFSQAIVAELREKQADPIGFAAREDRRARGEDLTMTVVKYVEDKACIFYTFNGRDFGTEWMSHAAAEDKALETMERRDLLTVVEKDMTGGK